MPPTTEENDPVRTALTVGALATGGYVAYRYLWVPRQIRRRTEDELWRRRQQDPSLGPDGLAQAGTAACMGLAAYYGIPPQGSQGMCNVIGPGAAALVRETPGLIEAYGAAAGSAARDIGEGVGAGVAGLGKGIGAGITHVGTAAVDVPAYAVGTVYSGGKGVVQDVYSGGKGVLVDLGEGAGTVYRGGKRVVGDVYQATVQRPVDTVTGAIGGVGRAAGRATGKVARGVGSAAKKLKFW